MQTLRALLQKYKQPFVAGSACTGIEHENQVSINLSRCSVNSSSLLKWLFNFNMEHFQLKYSGYMLEIWVMLDEILRQYSMFWKNSTFKHYFVN